MANDEFEYDVALSFAGEDRVIAREFAELLANKNIKVFYDEDYADDLWGKDLIAHLADLYQNKARFCVLFISNHYPLKRWTNFERQHIQARAFRDTNEYILPIRIDNTEVPGIAETLGYRDIHQQSLDDIANALEKKLNKVKGTSARSSSSQAVSFDNQEQSKIAFGSIPMPKRKKTFTQLEKDRFTRDTFSYIKEYFKHALNELQRNDPDIQTDFEEVTSQHFMSRIYVRGDLKAECNIWLGGSFGRNTISYNEGTRGNSTGSINESISIEDNGEELGLNFGLFGYREQKMATQQQGAEHLWERFTAPLGY
jgi:hypothetical protein